MKVNEFNVEWSGSVFVITKGHKHVTSIVNAVDCANWLADNAKRNFTMLTYACLELKHGDPVDPEILAKFK